MKEKKAMTRRQFIKDTSVATIGGTLLLGAPAPVLSDAAAGDTGKTTVVLVRNNDAVDADGNFSYPVIEEMLDSAVNALTGQKDPLTAWKTFLKPDDTLGIKSNNWPRLPTPKEVEKYLKKRAMAVGVSEADIHIQDKQIYKTPRFKSSTALINTRPLRTHHWSGVGSLIKNYITFVPTPWSYHDDSCADLAKLWALPAVKGKTRLNVLVMLTPQFHGVGPHSFSPKYIWNYFGLLVGVDPVAVDSVGVRILQAKRKAYFKEDRPLATPPKHIYMADTRHRLGTADPNKINLVKIGFAKDILI